ERGVQASSADPHSPWASADAWRIGHAGKRVVALSLHDRRYEAAAYGHGGDYRLEHGEATCDVRGAWLESDALSARFDGEAQRLPALVDDARVLLHDAAGRRHRFVRAPAFAWASTERAGGNQVLAPMPGRIVLVKAKPGDNVEEGQELLVMEAMKMELALKAPRAGTVECVSATQGEFVEADAVLVRFEN
ncbi:biotin/lipoyl-containing protein, partial [Frateuria sp.]|uniref:biotin/lipoyl-containing protein n=1 Tax=Frateuria sp. TaxID=2211372 RepID=UPI0017F4B840